MVHRHLLRRQPAVVDAAAVVLPPESHGIPAWFAADVGVLAGVHPRERRGGNDVARAVDVQDLLRRRDGQRDRRGLVGQDRAGAELVDLPEVQVNAETAGLVGAVVVLDVERAVVVPVVLSENRLARGIVFHAARRPDRAVHGEVARGCDVGEVVRQLHLPVARRGDPAVAFPRDGACQHAVVAVPREVLPRADGGVMRPRARVVDAVVGGLQTLLHVRMRRQAARARRDRHTKRQ